MSVYPFHVIHSLHMLTSSASAFRIIPQWSKVFVRIHIYRYLCMHMRVHTFIHQYQYRYTNTEGYDYASIMCGDLYALTTSKVSTWAVPATRPMEPSFRQGSFQKPSVLSAQAAGSDSPPGPRSKENVFFLKVIRTRLFKTKM